MLIECYKQVLRNWFREEKSKRKFIDFALSIIEKNWKEKNIFIIEAPTGYGKSTISAALSLFSLKDKKSLKSIVAFPLRTLLKDQYDKFVKNEVDERGVVKKRSILGDVNYELRTRLIGKRYMHNADSRYLIKPITLTTIDTLSLTLFGIPPESLNRVAKSWNGTNRGSLGHYLFSWASVALSNIILDEVHLLADTTKSISFLIALMKIAIDFDQKLILMSATVPEKLKEVIMYWAKRLNFDDKICLISFSKETREREVYTSWDETFEKERLGKKYKILLEKVEEEEKFDKIIEWVSSYVTKGLSKVIVVFNTALEAIEFYKRKANDIKQMFGSNVVLLHSRFTEDDRGNKIETVKKFKDKEKYLIVSTQVIEAGVDISSNLFITDIAPANSLIQRLGRFLRYPGENEGIAIIWYETDKNELLKKNEKASSYKVYDYNLTCKTLKWLKSHSTLQGGTLNVNLNVHLPESNGGKLGYKTFLNDVYEDSNCFKVDEEAVTNFEGIFLHLENASLIAIKKFVEMEGSFVREGLMIPVIPQGCEKEFIEVSSEKELRKLIRKYVIPISVNLFKSIMKKATKARAIAKRINSDEGKKSLEIIQKELRSPSYISVEHLLSYILSNDIIAFVIDKGIYLPNEGFMVGSYG